MEISTGKSFEKPDAGMFLGTIIDVVDMPNIVTQYGVKNKVRIQWVLSKTDGSPALDSQGNSFTVVAMHNATLTEKSNLMRDIKMILNGVPPVINSTEQLAQLLIGRSNQLFLTKTANPAKVGDFFINVNGIAPLVPGQVPPQAPQGFVRSKDRQAQPKMIQSVATTPTTQTTVYGQENNLSF